MNSSTLKVTGMSCGACARHVGEALEPLAGVDRVEVDLAAGLVHIDGTAATEALIAALDAAGYPPVEPVPDTAPRKRDCSSGCCCHGTTPTRRTA